MSDFNNVNKVLEDYGSKAIEVLTSKMDAYGLENLQGTLHKEITTDQTSSTLNVYMAFYGEYVDSGRKPGKFAPVQVISDWCDRRGFNGGAKNKRGFNTATYPVNFKIARDGIKARPFLNEFVKLYPSYENKIYNALEEDVLKEIDIKQLENGNNNK